MGIACKGNYLKTNLRFKIALFVICYLLITFVINCEFIVKLKCYKLNYVALSLPPVLPSQIPIEAHRYLTTHGFKTHYRLFLLSSRYSESALFFASF